MTYSCKDETKRRIELVRYLNRHEESHVDELAHYFSVTKQTIYNDLNYIETEMNVPIERKRGNNGYIRINKEWRSNLPHIDREGEIAVLLILSIPNIPEVKKTLENIELEWDVYETLDIAINTMLEICNPDFEKENMELLNNHDYKP